MTQPKRQWHELPLPTQAAIRCNEPKFLRFLIENIDDLLPLMVLPDAERAAAIVRLHCDIVSRRDLATDQYAADVWRSLDASYSAWLADQHASPPPPDDAPPHDHDPMEF